MSGHKCSINAIPYDVLCEIFIQCLPEGPPYLANRQPDTAIAPMLLCQVCSLWRKVALGSAMFWSRLSFQLSIQKASDEWALFLDELEFLRWWKTNQGSMAPFLIFSVNILPQCDIREEHHVPLDDAYAKFIVEYLATAQYLAADAFFWKITREWILSGNRVEYPNLHILVRSHNSWSHVDNPEFYVNHRGPIFHETQLLVGENDSNPTINASSLLLRLRIDGDNLLHPRFPAHWSSLTHISLLEVDITLGFWYAIIRAVPNLQSGYVNIRQLLHILPIPRHSDYTLAHLETLFVEVYAGMEHFTDPLDRIFINLHMPALRVLSLSSYAESWSDHAIEELNYVFESTPSITKLCLGGDILAFGTPSFSPETREALAHTQPIWMHATHLTDLEIELRHYYHYRLERSEAEETLDDFIRDIFFPENKWLDLANPGCTIRKLTIVNCSFDTLEEFAVDRAHALAEKIPNVDFRITFESKIQKARDAWKEWV